MIHVNTWGNIRDCRDFPVIQFIDISKNLENGNYILGTGVN